MWSRVLWPSLHVMVILSLSINIFALFLGRLSTQNSQPVMTLCTKTVIRPSWISERGWPSWISWRDWPSWISRRWVSLTFLNQSKGWPSWISGRGWKTTKIISQSVPMKVLWQSWDSNFWPLDLQSDALLTKLWSPPRPLTSPPQPPSTKVIHKITSNAARLLSIKSASNLSVAKFCQAWDT